MRTQTYFILFYLLGSLGCSAPSSNTNLSAPPPPDSLLVSDTINYSGSPQLQKDTFFLKIDYDTTLWTELIRLDSNILLDMKYATMDNFVQEKMYECARCFLRPEVAKAIAQVHQELQMEGYGLKIFDCFRPHPIQWKLWKKIPDPRYVTDPNKGSMHNRGAAVDLTLTDSLGQELDLGTPFDYFGREAYHSNTQLPDSILARRQLLKSIMETNGFRAIRTEWWHYSFQQKSYVLSDMLWKCYE